MALTFEQAELKVDRFVTRFGQKAEASDLFDETQNREEAVANILANTDPEALDSFAETVTELTAIRTAMDAADGSIQQAALALAQSTTTAVAAVQSDLDAYKLANDEHVDVVESKVDYVIENLPQSGGAQAQAQR